MYEAHFGLTRRPFVETVHPSAFVSLPSRESVLHRLRYGIEHGRGPALLFGPSGVGKTLLAATLARELGGAAHVTFPAIPTPELLALLVEELGLAPPGGEPTLRDSLGRLRRGLAAAAARGERPLLIVDEAHLIDDPATFEALRLLLNFAAEGPPDLSLLLVGGPEVLLRIPEGLVDRLAARCLLGPFTEPETEAYLRGRVEAAGGPPDLFPPDAAAALHRAAGGRPRRINRLADLGLLIAYAEGRPGPDERTVSLAAREAEFEALAV